MRARDCTFEGMSDPGAVSHVELVDAAAPTAHALASAIASGERSPVEVVATAVERALMVQPSLNCFTSIWVDEAMAEAERAAQDVAAGRPLGVLHGVPVAIKDTSPAAGHLTTFGSHAFADYVPDHDAYVVGALRRAGAIIIGQTTTPEFAHTLRTDSPRWGVTRNPHRLDRTPGGSSGGSAAAVASGCVPLAEGSDMGGSVRIPAAWCGIVGLKPGLGRIPMDVLPALFDTISHHGPLARCADDARLFLAATQGPDDADILSVPGPLDLSRPLDADIRGLRLGLSVDLGSWLVDEEIAAAVTAMAEQLGAAGAEVDVVDPGVTPYDEAAWVEVWRVFMAANYGELVAAHRERMDPEVLQLIAAGEAMSAVHYKRLERVRTSLWHRLRNVLAGRDALLCPTMAQPPWPAAKADGVPAPPPGDGYPSPDMTSIFNLVAPCPALSVPCGEHARPEHAGLPIGLQIVGPRWREDIVLRIARAVEVIRGS